MKENLVHLCFVLDESGSMYESTEDVIGSFMKLINEQKQVKEGDCLVSLYKFATNASKVYLGTPIDEISPLFYKPSGCTAMNDGIGMAIDDVGKWLADMDESERPSKNIFIIMTDGQENNSKEYSLTDVQDRIKHQEEKYNWSFVYMGTDVGDLTDADTLGITRGSVSGRDNISNNFAHINSYACAYRSAASLKDVELAEATLSCALQADTSNYTSQASV